MSFIVLCIDFLNYGVFGDMNGDLALQWLKSMTPARGFVETPCFSCSHNAGENIEQD